MVLPFWQMSYTADSWSLSLLTLRVLVGAMAMKLVSSYPLFRQCTFFMGAQALTVCAESPSSCHFGLGS